MAWEFNWATTTSHTAPSLFACLPPRSLYRQPNQSILEARIHMLVCHFFPLLAQEHSSNLLGEGVYTAAFADADEPRRDLGTDSASAALY